MGGFSLTFYPLQASNGYVDSVLDRVAFKWSAAMAGSCSGTDGQSQGNLQFYVVKGTTHLRRIRMLSIENCTFMSGSMDGWMWE